LIVILNKRSLRSEGSGRAERRVLGDATIARFGSLPYPTVPLAGIVI
jgi:hypothetical protein